MSQDRAARVDGHRVVKDVVVVLVAFVVAAAVAGALWPELVDPVIVERAEQGILTDEVALGDRFDTIGWYTLLGGGFGLLLGVVLVALRRGPEVITLLAVLVGACLAAWLSARIGSWLGPDDPNQVLQDATVGATAEDRVVLTADVAYLVWPISALVGSVVVLWSRPGSRSAPDGRKSLPSVGAP
jgi:hypothetical protein